MTSQPHNLVIVGSGPAGHTAAIYAGRALLEPVMYEGWMAGGVAPGGQLTTTTDVENFPGFPEGIGGIDLMMLMRKQSVVSGTTIHTKTVDAIVPASEAYGYHTVVVGDEQIQTRTVIIATGATAKKLDAPGVATYRNRGVSGCAVCDGALPIFRDKILVVIGGGDVAMEEALYLTKYGKEVHILVRSGQLKASPVMSQRAADHPKISFHYYTELVEVHGDEGAMTAVTMIDNRTKERVQIPAGGLFFAIGHTPNTGFVRDVVDTDEQGYIITTPGSTHTSVPGIFAAGDVQDKIYRQAVTSAGSGCMAALDAEHYLSAHQ